MKLNRTQWVKIYNSLINSDSDSLADFKIGTEGDGQLVVLEFTNPHNELMFALRYL